MNITVVKFLVHYVPTILRFCRCTFTAQWRLFRKISFRYKRRFYQSGDLRATSVTLLLNSDFFCAASIIRLPRLATRCGWHVSQVQMFVARRRWEYSEARVCWTRSVTCLLDPNALCVTWMTHVLTLSTQRGWHLNSDVCYSMSVKGQMGDGRTDVRQSAALLCIYV